MARTRRIVTSEIVVSHAHCPRKAYLLLCTKEPGEPHEYFEIIQARKQEAQRHYLRLLRERKDTVQSYSSDLFSRGATYLTNATLREQGLVARCGLLTRVQHRSSLGRFSYEPSIFIGTERTSQEDRIELAYVAHVLGHLQGRPPASGRIVDVAGISHRTKLGTKQEKQMLGHLRPVRQWADKSPSETQPLVLNGHCPLCRFCDLCREDAEEEDNLSLLSLTPKAIAKFHSKGIFTTKQLSYAYRPRRKRKKSKMPAVIHQPELRALAIRTQTTYLIEVPTISRSDHEFFLDIEGVPDQGFYYLAGLLDSNQQEGEVYQNYWAATREDEAKLAKDLFATLSNRPATPIFHYGSYDKKALIDLGGRYEIPNRDAITARLVNLNSQIHGKVYFPSRSNSIKDLARALGMSWRSPEASGLQSLVWRHRWEETSNRRFKKLLLEYNEDDCRAAKLVADRLLHLSDDASSMADVDYADQPKQHSTELGSEIHTQFTSILKIAHLGYEDKKISLRKDAGKLPNRQKPASGYHRIIPKPNRIIRVRRKLSCPRHRGHSLKEIKKQSERIVIDLVFSKNGTRKSIVKYVGTLSNCGKCNRQYIPPMFDRLGAGQLFGHAFQSWATYCRVVLRLSYRSIVSLMEEQFKERVTPTTVGGFVANLAKRYSRTERRLETAILASPFVHVDETKISIQGALQYVWVFTDGTHVVFKLTETRETAIVQKTLAGYQGVLVTDFYGGFDSIECRQQKCWPHLIRDLNDDLWKSPFNTEYEMFVSEVRNLIVPIMETIQKFGLKHRYLKKYQQSLRRFYRQAIDTAVYKTDVTIKYQKRFHRYKKSLFTFLEGDGIPWNNNMAERALRHLAIQRKISGSFFATGARDYLLFLGIAQTCRFQNKSMLDFLLSEKWDVDSFKKRKKMKTSRPNSPKSKVTEKK